MLDSRRTNTEAKAKLIGVVLTIGLHAAAVCIVSLEGFSYIYPPPAEKSVLIEFEEEVPPVIKAKRGKAPMAENVNKDEAVNLVQKSQSPVEAKRQNLTPETKPDDFGDVPTNTPEPKEEPKLDPRAAFPGMAKKDTTLTAEHSAEKASDSYKSGQADGNATSARSEGKPNAQLKGRKTVGQIARPVYNVQESGIVVVDIWVDNYGNVTKAVPGGDGTTVLNKYLLSAARNAALQTHFNMSADAPATQQGTITYYFNLK